MIAELGGTRRAARAQPLCIVDRLVQALNVRDVDALVALAAADVVLEVRGLGPGLAQHNEHLWRSVSARGQEELRRYFAAFFQALPSVRMKADEPHGLPCWASFGAEVAGVDSDGRPFRAWVYLRLRGDGTSVRRITVEVLELETGPDLLTRADLDPRRYFEPFLRSA